MGDWKKVKKLHEEGMPIRQIAREMDMSRNTVRNWIRSDERPKNRKRDHYPTKIDDYKADIKEWYLNNGYIGAKIYRELKKKGYKGSKNPIYRYLEDLRKDERK